MSEEASHRLRVVGLDRTLPDPHNGEIEMGYWLDRFDDNPFDCKDHIFEYLREDKRWCRQCGLIQYLKWYDEYKNKGWFTLME